MCLCRGEGCESVRVGVCCGLGVCWLAGCPVPAQRIRHRRFGQRALLRSASECVRACWPASMYVRPEELRPAHQGSCCRYCRKVGRLLHAYLSYADGSGAAGQTGARARDFLCLRFDLAAHAHVPIPRALSPRLYPEPRRQHPASSIQTTTRACTTHCVCTDRRTSGARSGVFWSRLRGD
ncbi:uncharacterized protein K452DRAFT_128648 [Aplosporella prunicola CBS 121167]|uniref:Uncharacterized protein n=1 Tax=Aplosporella prunicola CBS 121167 TaxID=1176127 RepID=A0A6A6AXB9_9PEZI|nr:uncharacterized protein K452DRAFT_128648 [Aplosporella prunicola CBS 121167]KAF2136579.1 hypothetical protein K452DRAFT_128648 [Aplosporella prunicola CBS 121167]